MTSIFIADDHPLLRSGLERFLIDRNYNIIGIAENGRSALKFIIRNEPDIAILDVDMPYINGIEIAEQCQKINLKSKIILITGHKEVKFYLEAKKFNIYGYILKEFTLEEIEKCILSVNNNTPFFSKKLKNSFGFTSETDDVLGNLSVAEKRVVKLIAQFKTNAEIASLLFLSKRTIETHRSNIVSKLNLEKKTRVLNVWVEKNMHLF